MWVTASGVLGGRRRSLIISVRVRVRALQLCGLSPRWPPRRARAKTARRARRRRARTRTRTWRALWCRTRTTTRPRSASCSSCTTWCVPPCCFPLGAAAAAQLGAWRWRRFSAARRLRRAVAANLGHRLHGAARRAHQELRKARRRVVRGVPLPLLALADVPAGLHRARPPHAHPHAPGHAGARVPLLHHHTATTPPPPLHPSKTAFLASMRRGQRACLFAGV